MADVSQFDKATFRDMVLRAADAKNTERWDATPGVQGEVDLIISMALDREWRRILNADPYRRVRAHTLTSEPEGDSDAGKYSYATLRNFTPPDDPAAYGERLYRVLAVKRDNVVYHEETFKDNVATPDYNPSANVWYREGDFIVLSPIQPSTQATFYISHIPARFADIEEEEEFVRFPGGYELIPIYEAAALLLSKVGAEYKATQELKQLAQEYREDMLSDMARFSNNPTTFRYSDTSFEWGGS